MRCLGPLEVQLGRGALTGFDTRKALALLVYLACHVGLAFPRERLQSLLWGDSPPDRAARSLRQALVNLRRVLPGEFLIITRGSVAFNPQSVYDLDVARFESNPPDLALYRGTFLDGFDLRDAPEWEEWVSARREELQARALTALETSGARHAARGEYSLAAGFYHRALAIDPWRETSHQALIRMYALTGDRAAALAQYEKCRAALAGGLGVEPLPETQTLYHRVLEGTLAPEESPRVSAPPLPFVGRGDAYAKLMGAWNESRAHGPRLTLIEGEAGLGKTRLIEEVLRQLAMQGAVIARGQCVEFAAEVPYRSIVQALRAIADFGSRISELQSAISPIWLSELTRLLPELRESHPNLPRPRAGTGEAARQRLFEAVTRFLRACGETLANSDRRAALVIFLDDLHWADRATLDLLHHLVHSLAGGHPIWFVGAYRPEEEDDELPHSLARLRQSLGAAGLAQRVELAPLSAEAVAEIAASLSDDPAFAAFLQRESGGSPLMLSEVIKNLQETGRLKSAAPGRWQIVGGLSGDPLRAPERVENIALQRVDRLPPESQRLLDFAAVIGESFTGDLLAEASGEPAVALAESLDSWQRRRLIRSDAAGNFNFSHDKIRAAIYHHIPADMRKLLHERIGQTLLDYGSRSQVAQGSRGQPAVSPVDQSAPDYSTTRLPDPIAAQVAYHFERSFAPRRAKPYLAQAAEAARQVHANDAAIEYYHRLLPLLSDGEDIEVWRALGEGLRSQARHAEAVEAYAHMRAGAERAGDLVAQARAWIGLSWVQERLGDHRAVLESARRAEEIARAAGEPAQVELARALALKGWALFRTGGEQEALQLGEQALALCAAIAPRAQPVMARTLLLLGAAHTLLGNYEQAFRYKEQALVLYHELGDREAVGNTLNNLGETARLRGDFRRALDYYRQAIAIAREIGDRTGEMVRLSNLGGARVGVGEFEAAESDLRAVIRLSEPAGERVSAAYSYLFLSEALLGQSRWGEAAEAAQRAFELGRELQLPDAVALAWRALGKIAAHGLETILVDGAVYNAPACFAESARVCNENQLEGERARTLRAWADHELARGDKARGELMMREAKEVFARLDMVW